MRFSSFSVDNMHYLKFQGPYFDPQGLWMFTNILLRNQEVCEQFLATQKFAAFLNTTISPDVIIIDHFLQVNLQLTISTWNFALIK